MTDTYTSEQSSSQSAQLTTPLLHGSLSTRRNRPPHYRTIREVDLQRRLNCFQLFSMTLGLAGMQFIWTVEFSYGTPYLLQLGLAKPLVALVWLAGPLSGLFVQPLVGVLSDRCKSRLGRRRPFIIISSLLVVASIYMIIKADLLADYICRWLELDMEVSKLF
jgi:hypothetical protein